MDESFLYKLVKAKRRLLKLHFDAHHGHIGGDFSCIDALMVLHHRVIGSEDRFVLSKGHSAGALYVTLWSLGLVSEDALQGFCREKGTLGAHPSAGCAPGVLFSTGSLGHGASLCCGLALAAKKRTAKSRVWCLCSDGEWQEGSSWEALAFAVHHRLDNLVFLVDANGWQGFGRTCDVACSTPSLEERFRGFGANVETVCGHDHEAIFAALSCRTCAPLVLVLQTVKGNGLYFADALESHYLPLNEREYQDALARLRLEDGY